MNNFKGPTLQLNKNKEETPLSIFQRVCRFNNDAGTKLGQEWFDNEEASHNEYNMLFEEFSELGEALDNKDRVEAADALADIIYVAMGTMAKLGIDYEKVMDEVCKSNESKYSPEGTLIKNTEGKIQKGDNFKKPDLSFTKEVDKSFQVPLMATQWASGAVSYNEMKHPTAKIKKKF